MVKVKIAVALIFLFLLYGCSTGSSIVTGKIRTPTNPSEVKIYLDSPLQYETIGIVEASSDVEISTQAAQDRAINELKEQAAKIGANGVILQSSGVFIAETGTTKTVKGIAVYVTQE